MAKIWGRILAVTGIVACPCHLPFTLPLLLGVLARTGLGSFVATHTGLIYGVATGHFVVGLAGGLFLLNRRRGQANASCDIPPQRRRSARKQATGIGGG